MKRTAGRLGPLDEIAVAFAASVVYAAAGNAIMVRILSRRRIPFRSVWAGTPFYLYGVCIRMTPASRALRAFALSTDVAFVLALPVGAWLMIASP
jgi:hypothetical protein